MVFPAYNPPPANPLLYPSIAMPWAVGNAAALVGYTAVPALVGYTAAGNPVDADISDGVSKPEAVVGLMRLGVYGTRAVADGAYG